VVTLEGCRVLAQFYWLVSGEDEGLRYFRLVWYRGDLRLNDPKRSDQLLQLLDHCGYSAGSKSTCHKQTEAFCWKRGFCPDTLSRLITKDDPIFSNNLIKCPHFSKFDSIWSKEIAVSWSWSAISDALTISRGPVKLGWARKFRFLLVRKDLVQRCWESGRGKIGQTIF